MATLIQNQANFVAQQANFVAQLAEIRQTQLAYERETAERFARIEMQIGEIIRILAEHSRLLERLPEAVRDKIGFKMPT